MSKNSSLQAVSDLVEIAGRLGGSTVVVAGGDRIEDLQLVEAARDHGIIDRIILVGENDSIRRQVDESGIDIARDDIMSAHSDDRCAAVTVDLIAGGGIDIVLKGNISTPVLNRHMLPLARRSTVSLASVFDAEPIAAGRPMILTDAGFTTVCTFGRLADLVRNAVDVAHRVLELERPRVAILSANEKQIPSLPSTWIGKALAERVWPDAVVCGPLSFDLATDIESVAIKGQPEAPHAEEVAGRADVLVCPGIDAANILYKTIAAMVKYGQASIAGITVGFPVPYIILSRSDALETRLQSIALSSIYANRGRGVEPSVGGTTEPASVVARAAHLAGRSVHDLKLVVVECGESVTVSAMSRGKTVESVAVQATGGEATQAARIAKEVGGLFVTLGCDVEAVVIVAPDRELASALRRSLGRLAPVVVFDDAHEGEDGGE